MFTRSSAQALSHRDLDDVVIPTPTRSESDNAGTPKRRGDGSRNDDDSWRRHKCHTENDFRAFYTIALTLRPPTSTVRPCAAPPPTPIPTTMRPETRAGVCVRAEAPHRDQSRRPVRC